MTSRERFEKWATDNGHNLRRAQFEPEHYALPTTEAAWHGWQASREGQVKVLRDVRDRLASSLKDNELSVIDRIADELEVV